MGFKIYLMDWRKHGMPDYNKGLMRDKYYLAYESSNPKEFNLDGIYAEFNIDHPDDYEDRSVSIGDVILLDGVHYIVKPWGFGIVDFNNTFSINHALEA